MNLLSTDLAPIVAAVLVAASAWIVRAQAHARHEVRVRQILETTGQLQRRAVAARQARDLRAASPDQGLPILKTMV